MSSETTVGGIVGTLRLEADQFHREVERAIAETDRLDGKKVDVKVKADTGAARAELGATSAQVDKLDRANTKLDQSSRSSGRGMRALATSIVTVGPAIVPLAAATVGLAAGFGAMGTAGVFAIVGIKHEMDAGTSMGREYSATIDVLKDNVNDLGKVAARGVLEPFRAAVASLQTQMPSLNRIIGEFSAVTGRTAGSLMTGLVGAFVLLEPLMRDVGTYTFGLSQRFREMMTGPGVVSFGDYVRSVFPQVMQAVESLVGAALHLVAALAPLGMGILTALGALSDIISAIPVDVLAALATTASSVFLGFKSYGLISGLITGVSGALVKMGVSAGVAAAGMAALNIAAAGIGAIIAVATFLYTRHAEAVRQDQQTVDEYTDALRRSNGVIDENVRAKAFQVLQDNGAFDAAKRLGISLNLVTDAALGNTYASRQLASEMSNAARAQTEFEAGGARTGRTSAETNSALIKLNETVGTNTGQLTRAQQAQKDWAEASQVSTFAATSQDRAQTALAGKLGTTTAALLAAQTNQQKTADTTAAATLQMQLQNDAAGLLKQALDDLNGKALSSEQAQNRFDSALANSNKHIAANGKTIDRATTSLKGNSAAAVANRSEILGQIDAAQNAAVAFRDEGHSQAETTAKMNTMKAAIIQNAKEHGLNTKQVQAYIDKLFKVPKKLPPTKLEVDTKNALATLAAFKTALAGLKNKTVVITTQGRFINNSGADGSKSTVGGQTKDSANGNIFRAFASGGFENHVAQIAPAGAMRLWAEPETGGEAYIPLAPSKRGRSTAILEETNRLMGNPLGGSGIDYDRLAAALSRVNLYPVVTAGSFDRAMGGQMR